MPFLNGTVCPQASSREDTPLSSRLDSSREFRVSTSDLNHFACKETVLAGFEVFKYELDTRNSRARLG
jgi:hypothetical protein